MKWTPQQEQALSDVSDWLRDPRQQVFRLFGYAGTGKTTLARHLSEGVEGQTFFAAYTGKAAHVLQQRGCPGARTIHSLIYTSKDRSKASIKQLEAEILQLAQEMRQGASPGLSEERLADWINSQPRVKELRKKLEDENRNAARPSFSLNEDSTLKEAALIVIDECSMVDATMGHDLLSFKKKVLVLGDPAQLPPVMGGGYFTEAKPDIMLTDIQRQARDNPIIEMATLVRNQKRLALGNYGDSVVRNGATASIAMEADQLLVGRNRTRHSCNARHRQLLGRTNHLPEPGDRLVCLRNNSELGLLNGALWNTASCDDIGDDKLALSLVAPENENTVVDCEAHRQHFEGREKELPFYERKEAQEFDYGYALTVHKAQGSQWPNVLLFDESDAFRDDRWRWLYTGITRAAEKLTVALV